jgi:hypothetical protein
MGAPVADAHSEPFQLALCAGGRLVVALLDGCFQAREPPERPVAGG